MTQWTKSIDRSSSTISGRAEIVDFLCWDSDSASSNIASFLVTGNTRKVAELLKLECSALPWTHEFTFYWNDFSDIPLPIQDEWEEIGAIVITSTIINS